MRCAGPGRGSRRCSSGPRGPGGPRGTGGSSRSASRAWGGRATSAGEGRKAHVDDGVIGDEDLAVGNTDTGLPAGNVSIAPFEDSANGTFVADVKIPQVGTLIDGLSWTFQNGRVVEFSAKRNGTSGEINWGEGTGAKEMFASLGIGLDR